ncbi:MAG: CMP-N-acetlyneuraminic acid synthetase [Clostridiales bacterium]|jgi:CMP-N-acetylneuraminic acid synthetase|nr:CMP-N-acetlyneuraminic acid synthetase [Clostridiales bacterium]
MYKNKKILAIIPARSGSKGLKDKNIKELNGKPLIAYSIDAAMLSNIFEKVMVSTDSEEYAMVARKYGAEVPELRPTNLSGDTSQPNEYIEHALELYQRQGIVFDYYVILQPTSPLRLAEDIINAVDIAINEQKVHIVGVSEVEHSPRICNVLPKDESLNNFLKKEDQKNRQELGKYYRINGAIYIVEISKRAEEFGLYGEESKAYIMPKDKSIDIDSELDFILAEILLTRRKN